MFKWFWTIFSLGAPVSWTYLKVAMLIDKNKIVSFCLELTSYLCIIQKNIVLSTNMAACFMSRDRKNH